MRSKLTKPSLEKNRLESTFNTVRKTNCKDEKTLPEGCKIVVGLAIMKHRTAEFVIDRFAEGGTPIFSNKVIF